MKILKGYTKNLYHPEAFIVKRYIAEEAIEFCSEYIEKAKPVGLSESRHDDRKRWIWCLVDVENDVYNTPPTLSKKLEASVFCSGWHP